MTKSYEKITTKKQVESFIDKFDDFLFDCDGVLWKGTHLLPSIKETLDYLRSKNKRLIFVTNNSTKSRLQYAEKFKSLGLTVKETEIFGSSYSTAVYLSKVVGVPQGKKVYIIGEKGLEQELKAVGIETIGGTDPQFQSFTQDDLDNLEYDESIHAVVCGLDLKFNYYKIAKGMIQLKNQDTHFLATNIDSTFPAHGKLLPGAGTVVGCLETCSGREAIALGKPSQAMMDCIKADYHFDPQRACMVGDRLNTDIKFGNEGGLGTLMVLTGISNEEEASAPNAVAKPDFVIGKLGDLFELTSDK